MPLLLLSCNKKEPIKQNMVLKVKFLNGKTDTINVIGNYYEILLYNDFHDKINYLVVDGRKISRDVQSVSLISKK